ncbi:MAG: UDP-N-acetylmuramate dehydrogenase [Eubacteriales bacterium]|nr:UDP-N-acetylmuramate dehydrogenase [Eubacteriales bacterium]
MTNHPETLLREIRQTLPGLPLWTEEPLADHCSFRIGGPCTALAAPRDPEETEALCRILRSAGERPVIIGNGSNLLIDDAPLPYFVLKLADGMSAAEVRDDCRLEARCGIALARLAVLAANHGLTGLEFAHGIPGTLGGAVLMNAGAYGGEIKDVLVSARWLDADLELREAPISELDMTYRHSRFSEGSGDVILSAVLQLRPGDPDEITAQMRELAAKRRASQPLELPSAGSTFKRPANGYAAALIDQAGLKGYTVGRAAVSEKHAGFVVNLGGARYDDVRRVMAHVQEEVFRQFGIQLEPEVRILTAQSRGML